jgi:hypothetical protein
MVEIISAPSVEQLRYSSTFSVSVVVVVAFSSSAVYSPAQQDVRLPAVLGASAVELQPGETETPHPDLLAAGVFGLGCIPRRALLPPDQNNDVVYYD